jgi:hypothetical protein
MFQMLAALVVLNMLAAMARADASYSGALDATFTVSGFLDAEDNPISKPVELTLTTINTYFDDSFIFVEGDATGDADAAIDVIADDPLDLDAGDRFKFDLTASGTTVYPTGISLAFSTGIVQIEVGNSSPDPVTILFDFDYDYALNTSVDDPALEYAYAGVGFGVNIDSEFEGLEPENFFFVEQNASQTDMGSVSLEVTLLPGEFEIVNAFAFAGGDPFTIPEPTSWLLGAIGAAMLLGAGRRRRSQHNLPDSSGGRPCR